MARHRRNLPACPRAISTPSTLQEERERNTFNVGPDYVNADIKWFFGEFPKGREREREKRVNNRHGTVVEISAGGRGQKGKKEVRGGGQKEASSEYVTQQPHGLLHGKRHNCGGRTKAATAEADARSMGGRGHLTARLTPQTNVTHIYLIMEAVILKRGQRNGRE